MPQTFATPRHERHVVLGAKEVNGVKSQTWTGTARANGQEGLRLRAARGRCGLAVHPRRK